MTESPLEKIIEDIKPTVEGIIRKKLRVSLDPKDGRYDNQNALELCQKIYIILLEQLNRSSFKLDGEAFSIEAIAEEEKLTVSDGENIRNIKDYAAMVTYRAVAGYIGDQYPNWCSLRNRLNYFLNHQQGFAIWKTDSREKLCGFVSWQNQKN